jgi:hypothetical protein
MDYLIRVFKDKSFLGDSIERLPDDIKVLREKYQINYPEENIRNKLDHGEPTDVSDIKASVIWNTILRLVSKFYFPSIS